MDGDRRMTTPVASFKRFIVGPPLASDAEQHRLPKTLALPVFAAGAALAS